MTKSLLVAGYDEYKEVRASAGSACDVDARLPDMVFRSRGRSAVFFEFEVALSGDFWSMLQTVARFHGDERVDLIVLDPDGELYYSPEYGMYPAASLDVGLSEDEYWEVISEEPSGDISGAIAYSAEVVAFTGPSGAWACWGERALGVAAIQGVPDGAWRNEFGPLLTVGTALESYMAPNFRNSRVPPEFESALLGNYGPVDQ